MNYPEYSVLMSVYYKEKPEWFENSINSMLNQTIKPSEFVIVEDGPLTSELDDVVNKKTLEFPKLFKIVKIEKNGGLGPALKLGVENCSNEYIARMDSDDYCVPERVEKELAMFIKNPDLGMIGTNVIEFIEDINNQISRVVLPENNEEIIEFSKQRNPFRHPSIMFKKSEILKAGNYRAYYLFEDYDMWLRMLRADCKCYNLQDFLTYMRINDDFYKRRGGIKYLKSIYKFKKEQFSIGYINYREYLRTFIPHAIVCLLPNFMRDYIYRNYLRTKVKNK